MARKGGGLSAGAGGGVLLSLEFVVEGVERTSDDFKAVRREINGSLRDVMQRVGEREVLPAIVSRFPHSASSSGLPAGAMARSLYVKRDRIGVSIGSRLRGQLNRALGWIDFGGKRPGDLSPRGGPYVIVRTLDRHRDDIDDALRDELLREFERRGFEIA